MLKLEYYGIRNSVLEWISAFLSSHTQQVVCGGCYSDPVEVLSGVLQGIVLGPLLFLLYINDIPNQLASICRLYADNCILYRQNESKADVRILQNDLEILEECMGKNLENEAKY